MRPHRVVLALLLVLGAAAAQAQVAVTVTGYTITPEVFMPGDTGTVRVTVKNAGSSSATLDSATYYVPRFETLIGTYPNATSTS